MYSDAFAERIRKARKIKGVSLQEVALRLSLHNTTISQYELGKRQPNLDQLGKLATYYGVSADWLLGLSEENKLAG